MFNSTLNLDQNKLKNSYPNIDLLMSSGIIKDPWLQEMAYQNPMGFYDATASYNWPSTEELSKMGANKGIRNTMSGIPIVQGLKDLVNAGNVVPSSAPGGESTQSRYEAQKKATDIWSGWPTSGKSLSQVESEIAETMWPVNFLRTTEPYTSKSWTGTNPATKFREAYAGIDPNATWNDFGFVGDQLTYQGRQLGTLGQAIDPRRAYETMPTDLSAYQDLTRVASPQERGAAGDIMTGIVAAIMAAGGAGLLGGAGGAAGAGTGAGAGASSMVMPTGLEAGFTGMGTAGGIGGTALGTTGAGLGTGIGTGTTGGGIFNPDLWKPALDQSVFKFPSVSLWDKVSTTAKNLYNNPLSKLGGIGLSSLMGSKNQADMYSDLAQAQQASYDQYLQAQKQGLKEAQGDYASYVQAIQDAYNNYLNTINAPEDVKATRFNQLKSQVLQDAPALRKRKLDELASRGIRGTGLAAPIAETEDAVQKAVNDAYFSIYGTYNVPSAPMTVPTPPTLASTAYTVPQTPPPVNYAPSTGDLFGTNISSLGTLLAMYDLFGRQ